MLWKTRDLAILALLCITACSSDLLTPEQPEDISVHLTVRGTVTRGSQRLAGVKVTLSSITECRNGSGSGNPCTWTTVTDTEGEYSFDQVLLVSRPPGPEEDWQPFCGSFEVAFERGPNGIDYPLHWIDGCGPHTVDHTFPANQSPLVSITDPADGLTVAADAPILFSGTAEDPEEGSLQGESLVWESSLDGLLGTGGSIQRDDLSAGSHTITLTATDSEGLAASGSIQVVVVPASFPDVLIDFETLPDGTASCPGGNVPCDLDDQFLVFGVVFSGKVDPICSASSAWKFRSTQNYDPPGSPPNWAADNKCSVGTFSVDLLQPRQMVEFQTMVNNDFPVNLRAYDPSGQQIPDEAISREAILHTNEAGYVFRREKIRILSQAGIASFGWDTEYYGVFLDDLYLVTIADESGNPAMGLEGNGGSPD